MRVEKRAIMETGLSLTRKISLNHFSPFDFIKRRFDKKPAIKGITTKIITDDKRASKGISIFDIPSKNFTIGIKATSNTRSFIAT